MAKLIVVIESAPPVPTVSSSISRVLFAVAVWAVLLAAVTPIFPEIFRVDSTGPLPRADPLPILSVPDPPFTARFISVAVAAGSKYPDASALLNVSVVAAVKPFTVVFVPSIETDVAPAGTVIFS
jgi:hypothetical protein